jgi:hypothetical protein
MKQKLFERKAPVVHDVPRHDPVEWVDESCSDEAGVLRQINRNSPRVKRDGKHITVELSPSLTVRLVLWVATPGLIDASMVEKWQVKRT